MMYHLTNIYPTLVNVVHPPLNQPSPQSEHGGAAMHYSK